MKTVKKLTILMAFFVLSFIQIEAKEYRSLLLFGDGFSDTGAGYKISQNNGASLIPSNLYYQHHWSNGPIWAEYASRKLNIPLQNYAVGGATLGTSNATDFFWQNLGGIVQQIDRFAGRFPWICQDTITIIAGGQEDLTYALFQNNGLYEELVNSTVQEMLGHLQNNINQLIDLGAENIVLWNAIDVTASPIFSTEFFQPYTQLYSQGIDNYNQALPALIATINFSNPLSHVYLFDANSAFHQTLNDLQSQGIDTYDHTLTFSYGPPITSTFTGPTTSQLAWYDDKHPTTLFWKKFTPKILNFIITELDPTDDCGIKGEL